MLISNLRQRLARDESGFTLIELLVVLIIIAVLLAIAVPSYLGFKDRAEKRAAQSNVRAAVPAVEVFYSDDTSDNGGGGSYAGMTLTKLQTKDAAVTLTELVAAKQTATSYCISSKVGGFYASKAGPSAPIDVAKQATDPCAA
jgi:prepilin-type N-terminal cleavage/methylation domain-containing protein